MELYQLEMGILFHLFASYFGFCNWNMVYCDSKVAHTTDHQASNTEQLVELTELPLPFINNQLDINYATDSNKEYYKDIWEIKTATPINKDNVNTPTINKPDKSKLFLINGANVHSFVEEKQSQIKQDNTYDLKPAPDQYETLQVPVPAVLLQNNYHVQGLTKGNNSQGLHNNMDSTDNNILFDVLNNIGSYRNNEPESLANNSRNISTPKDIILENTPTETSFLLHSIDNTKEIEGKHAATRSKRESSAAQHMTNPLQKLNLEMKVRNTKTSPMRIFKRYLRGLGSKNREEMRKKEAKFILCSTGKCITKMRLGTDCTSSEEMQYSEENYSSESVDSDFSTLLIPSNTYKSSNWLSQSLTLNTLTDTSDIDSKRITAPNYGYKMESRLSTSLKFKPLISYNHDALDKDSESSETEEWSEEELGDFIGHDSMQKFDWIVTPKKATLDKIIVLGSPVPMNDKLNTADNDNNVTPQSTKKLEASSKESKEITNPYLEDVRYQFKNNKQMINTNRLHSLSKSTLSRIVEDLDSHKELYASHETVNQALNSHIHTDMKLKADNAIYRIRPETHQKVYYANPNSDTKVNGFSDVENAIPDEDLSVTPFFPQILSNYGIGKNHEHTITSWQSAFTQTNHQQPNMFISHSPLQVKYDGISEDNILGKIMETSKQESGHSTKTNPSATNTQENTCKIWKNFHDQAVDVMGFGNTKEFPDPHIADNLDAVGILSLNEVNTQEFSPNDHQVKVKMGSQEHNNAHSHVVASESNLKKIVGYLFPSICDFPTPSLPKTFHYKHQLDVSQSGSKLKETVDLKNPNDFFVLTIPHSKEAVQVQHKHCMPVEAAEIVPEVLHEKALILSPIFYETQSSGPIQIKLQEEQNLLEQSNPKNTAHLDINLPKEFHRGQYLDISHIVSEPEAHKITLEDLAFMSTPYSSNQGKFTKIPINEEITAAISSEKDISTAELTEGQNAGVTEIESPKKIPWPHPGLAKQFYNRQYTDTTDSDLKRTEITHSLIANDLPFLIEPIDKNFICAQPMSSPDMHTQQKNTQKQITSVDIGEEVITSSPEIFQRLHEDIAGHNIQQEKILKQDTTGQFHTVIPKEFHHRQYLGIVPQHSHYESIIGTISDKQSHSQGHQISGVKLDQTLPNDIIGPSNKLKMENCKLEHNNVHFTDTGSKHDKQQISTYVNEHPKNFLVNILNEPEITIPVNGNQEMEHHFEKSAISGACQQMDHSYLNTKSTVSTTLHSVKNHETETVKNSPQHAYFQTTGMSSTILNDSNYNFKNKKQNIVSESLEKSSGAVKSHFTADYTQQEKTQHSAGVSVDDLAQDDSVTFKENPSTKFLEMLVWQNRPSDIVLPVNSFSSEVKYINEQPLSGNLHNMEVIPSRITDINHMAVKIPWTSGETNVFHNNVVEPFEASSQQLGSIDTDIPLQQNNQELQIPGYAAKPKDIDQTYTSQYMAVVPIHTSQYIKSTGTGSHNLDSVEVHHYVSQRLEHSYENSTSTPPTTTPNVHSDRINDNITISHIQDLSESSELNEPDFDPWDLLKLHYKESSSQPKREKKGTYRNFIHNMGTMNENKTGNYLENYPGRNMKVNDTHAHTEASTISMGKNVHHYVTIHQPELISDKKLHFFKDMELPDGTMQMFNKHASQPRNQMDEEHGLLNPETVSTTDKNSQRDVNSIQLDTQLVKSLHSQENNNVELNATTPSEYVITSTTPHTNDVVVSLVTPPLLKTTDETEIFTTINHRDYNQDINRSQISNSKIDTVHPSTDTNIPQESQSLFLNRIPLKFNNLSLEQNKTVISVPPNESYNAAEHVKQISKRVAPGFQKMIMKQKRATQQATVSDLTNRKSNHETVNKNFLSELGRTKRSVQSSYSNEVDNTDTEPNFVSDQLKQNEENEKEIMTDSAPTEKQYNDLEQVKSNEVDNILYNQFTHIKTVNDIHMHPTHPQKDYNNQDIVKNLQQIQSQMAQQRKLSEWNIHTNMESPMYPGNNNYGRYKSSMLQKSSEVTPLANKLIRDHKTRPVIDTNLDIVRNLIFWLRDCVADIDKLSCRRNYNIMQR